MTRYKYYLMALVAAASAMMSCSNEDEGEEPVNGGQQVIVRFASGDGTSAATDNAASPAVRSSAATEDDGGFGPGIPRRGIYAAGGESDLQTRTTIGADGTTVLWGATDQIGITALVQGNTEATVLNKEYTPETATASARFKPTNYGQDAEEMTLSSGTYTFRSYYPRQYYDVETGKVSRFALNELTQSAVNSNEHIGKYDFMYAVVNNVAVTESTEPKVSFDYNHVFPLLHFTLTNASDKKVKAIVISDPSGQAALSGTADISLTDGTVTPTSPKSYARLTISTQATASEQAWLLIFPQAGGSGKSLTISVRTEDNTIYEFVKPLPSAGLVAGKRYDISLDLGTTTQKYSVPTKSGDVYQLDSESNLRWLAKTVTLFGENATSATLTASVTLDGEWQPIGNSKYTYEGTFDGGGHTISGLSITAAPAQYVGLFGNINKGTVENLRVKGNITAESSSNVGGIAGTLSGNSTVENCIFEGEVKGGSSNVGGIAGFNSDSQITGCYTKGSITGTSSSVGGIVGYNSKSITHCYSSATVTATNSNAGGIVGENGSTASVTTCYATGTVTAQSYAGGIVGSTTSRTTITNCIALNGDINRSTGNNDYFGRLVGISSGTIANCAAFSGMKVAGRTVNSTDANSKDGIDLSAADCLSTTPYDTRGFTTANGWAFDSSTPWTYLPWNPAFATFDRLAETDYKIPASILSGGSN